MSVYFFVPNIIGYVRVVFTILAFYFGTENYTYFFVFYALSQLLDAFDGYAARLLDQSTEYGAVLDMVTDRCSTTALLCVLGQFYPSMNILFISLIALDLTSHYAHLASSAKLGLTSHKATRKEQFFLIQLYYGNRYWLFTLCAANEGMFLGAYLLNFTIGPLITIMGYTMGAAELFFYLSLPLGILKQVMNLIQLMQAFIDLATYDEQKRLTKKNK